MPVPEPRRILIVRTSALGDVVHALPVLTALRRHLPEARIAWVVEASLAPLLRDHCDLDLLIPVRLRAWRHRPLARETLEEARGALAALRNFEADVVLDLMGNHKSGLLAAASGCDRRIGLARRHRREPSSRLWINEAVRPRGDHAVDHNLSLLRALDLPETAADFGGDRLLPEAAPPRTKRPYFVVHPGAGWENKRYPATWWGEAAGRISRTTGLAARVSGGPGEESLVRQVVAAGGGAVHAAEAGSLPALASLLRGARLVLAGDTGPLHLAHALGTPVLCLLGPTDPRRTGPYGAPESCHWQQLPCSFCHQRLDGVRACLLEIPPARVAKRALELL